MFSLMMGEEWQILFLGMGQVGLEPCRWTSREMAAEGGKASLASSGLQRLPHHQGQLLPEYISPIFPLFKHIFSPVLGSG